MWGSLSSSGNCSTKLAGMGRECSWQIAGSRPARRCSGCGWIDEDLTLSDRIFHCQACGLVLDRDLNAAINLAKLAGSLSDSLNACGADSAGSSREAGVQLSAKRGPRARKKQEQNTQHGASMFG